MTTVLAAENIFKSLGFRPVLRGASVTVNAGETLAILGENGSGKSTFLRILAGILSPDRGRLSCAVGVGYCPQEPLLYPHLTPDEHFCLFGAAYGLPSAEIAKRAADLLAQFGFEKHRTTRVERLSGGTKQKLNLALAILHDPPLLLLDEPYSGFDIETYHRFTEFMEHARSRGRSIVMVTHILFEQQRFDRVVTLVEGRCHA